MTVIVLKNWARHQHYKDRDPPWVKLYRDILTSESWVGEGSSDLSRLVQLACILLAARYSNQIPRAWNVIRKVTNLDCTEAEFDAAIAHLAATKFLEYQEREAPAGLSASKALAIPLHQERREEQSRAEERRGRARDVPRGTSDAGDALCRTPSAEDALAEVLNAWREVDGVDHAAMDAWLAHWSRVHAGREMPGHQRISTAKLLAGLGTPETQRRAVETAEANGWKSLRPGDGHNPRTAKQDAANAARAESERVEWRNLEERADRVGFRKRSPADDLGGYRALVERAEANQPRKSGGPAPIGKLLGRVQ